MPPRPFLGIAAELAQSLRHAVEQDFENRRLIAQDERVELMGQGEYDMEISDGQQLGGSRLKPLCFGERLTLGAMAVAAGIVGLPLETAIAAALKMPAQSGRAAGR